MELMLLVEELLTLHVAEKIMTLNHSAGGTHGVGVLGI